MGFIQRGQQGMGVQILKIQPGRFFQNRDQIISIAAFGSDPVRGQFIALRPVLCQHHSDGNIQNHDQNQDTCVPERNHCPQGCYGMRKNIINRDPESKTADQLQQDIGNQTDPEIPMFCVADFMRERDAVVDSQIHTADVTDRRLLKAFRTLPRENFVPKSRLALAYADTEIETASGRFMMRPRDLSLLIHMVDIFSTF